MDAAHLALKRIRATARPLLFRTNIRDYPVSVCGTAFLVGLERRVFAITAWHLVKDVHSGQILISPTEGPSGWLPLSNGYRMIPPSDDDPAEYDIVGYEVFAGGVPAEFANKSRILYLDPLTNTDWKPTAYVDQFFLCGYPREENEIDYSSRTFEAIQYLLAGTYVGMSNMHRAIHVLKVENPYELATFAGFSGSPVMSAEERLASQPAYRFSGVALFGTPTAGLMHFIEAAAVLELVKTIIGHSASYGHGAPPWTPPEL